MIQIYHLMTELEHKGLTRLERYILHRDSKLTHVLCLVGRTEEPVRYTLSLALIQVLQEIYSEN